jgi:hypothetical protein
MQNNRISILTLIGASVMAVSAASTLQPAHASINYNASKSNTGNFTAHHTSRCGPGMVKSCSGSRRHADVKQIDPNHGQPIGRRRHTAIMIRKEIDRPTP